MVFAGSLSGARAGPRLSGLRVRQQAYSFSRLLPAVIPIEPPDYVASYSGKYGSEPKQTNVLQSIAGEIPPLRKQPGNDGDQQRDDYGNQPEIWFRAFERKAFAVGCGPPSLFQPPAQTDGQK